MEKSKGIKVYYTSVYVGNYEVSALGTSAAKCIDLLVKEYHRQFGSFRENGFKNRADWLEYHGVEEEGLQEIYIDSAWTR